jgi:hypothetical protein
LSHKRKEIDDGEVGPLPVWAPAFLAGEGVGNVDVGRKQILDRHV